MDQAIFDHMTPTIYFLLAGLKKKKIIKKTSIVINDIRKMNDLMCQQYNSDPVFEVLACMKEIFLLIWVFFFFVCFQTSLQVTINGHNWSVYTDRFDSLFLYKCILSGLSIIICSSCNFLLAVYQHEGEISACKLTGQNKQGLNRNNVK